MRAAALVFGALAGLPAAAVTVQNEQAVVSCREPQDHRLRCEYRLQDGGTASAATLAAGAASIPAARLEPFAAGAEVTAVLFLVDTSDPGRQTVMSRYAEHIGRLLAFATPQRRFGLASFDAGLVMLDPVGAAPGAINRDAAALRATGLNTELYRSALEAIRRLVAVPAARRELILFSDGLAEDTAYHHDDVVAAARNANIVVSAIGYPRSLALAVGMQTLRRLSEDTGGVFVAASGPRSAVAPDVFTAMLAAAESGGTLEFGLGDLAAAPGDGAKGLTLTLQTANGPVAIVLPIDLERPLTSPARPAPAATPPPAGEARRGKRKEFVPPRGVGWPIAMATPIVLILAMALGFVIMARRRAREQPPVTMPAGAFIPAPEPGPAAGRAHAFLVSAGNPGERHAIASLPWRIGRSHNNDLCLEDRSVSRLHAEILMNEQGRYRLCDLASANGVFVNDERVDSAVLEEGDRVEIGEVALRFTCHDADYEAQEPTLMLRTRTPR